MAGTLRLEYEWARYHVRPTGGGNEGAARYLLEEDWTDRLKQAAKAARIDLQKLGPLKSAEETVV